MDHITLTERIQRLEAVAQNAGYNLNDYTTRNTADKETPWSEDIQSRQMHEKFAAMRMPRSRPAKSSRTPPPSAFEEIINRIQGCTDRVCLTANRLEIIGTRIMGELPQSDDLGKSSGRAIDGALDHTFMALDWLDGALSRLEFATNRIEHV